MEKSKIKTGIFGGSFNPIHMGHLALANYLCEYNGLDEIWFLVSPHNPLKQQTDLWDDNLRLELVKLAIADYPKFRASDFEFHLPRPSYTIHIGCFTQSLSQPGIHPYHWGGQLASIPPLVQSRGDFKESSCNDLSPSEFHY